MASLVAFRCCLQCCLQYFVLTAENKLLVGLVLSVTGIQHDVERCRVPRTVCAETVANGAKKLLHGI